ncbi:uncharacterized protein FA14DRAFT_179519 [Meira miltonrushii]|uniref:Uncharacterized protein n=1 Tax=Meira miltonrushii TaxID=1280837 RepID=A0A316VF50_9BASI|nr:uncharacterized protein FA14DRAFT_179519 [Meira miltonrushii]PWN36160.1 hypothetical protein FA14DRAFT_179519 [Meira miltonrushii]
MLVRLFHALKRLASFTVFAFLVLSAYAYLFMLLFKECKGAGLSDSANFNIDSWLNIPSDSESEEVNQPILTNSAHSNDGRDHHSLIQPKSTDGHASVPPDNSAYEQSKAGLQLDKKRKRGETLEEFKEKKRIWNKIYRERVRKDPKAHAKCKAKKRLASQSLWSQIKSDPIRHEKHKKDYAEYRKKLNARKNAGQ